MEKIKVREDFETIKIKDSEYSTEEVFEAISVIISSYKERKAKYGCEIKARFISSCGCVYLGIWQERLESDTEYNLRLEREARRRSLAEILAEISEKQILMDLLSKYGIPEGYNIEP